MRTKLPKGSPTEALYTEYISHLNEVPIVTREDLAKWVEQRTNYPPRVTYRYLDILVNRRKTWVEDGGGVRPKKADELPQSMSRGFSPVKVVEERPLLSSVQVVLLLVALLGVIVSDALMTAVSLLVLLGWVLYDVLAPKIKAFVTLES